MENGDIRDANILLNAALRLLVVTDHTPLSTELAQAVRFSWSHHAAIERDGNLGNDDIGPFIYSKGAVLDRGNQPNFGPKSEVRAVILYNAALATHLLANMTAKSAVMNRAKCLYILSRQVLRTRRDGGANSSLCKRHFFHVAILNNLGQINYVLTEFALAKMYFANAKQKVLFLTAYRRSEESQIFSISDLKGMCGNVMMEMPTTAACA
jgi:hypothetical protein